MVFSGKNTSLVTWMIKPLHIMLPKMSTYVRNYDGETKSMHFLIEDNELFKKYI